MKKRKVKLDPNRRPQPQPRSVKPLKPGERRKIKFGDGSATVYEDTDPTENQLTYSKEGYKCHRCFVISQLPISPNQGVNGYGTLWDAMYQSGIPVRGEPHPYINASTWEAYFGTALPAGLEFAADVITVTPVDSQNFKATVEYAMLNGATHEPTAENNTSIALLQPASSVQQINTNIDWEGNKLVASYNPDSADYDIYDSSNTQVLYPTSMSTASKQIPSPIFRFLRRETTARSPSGIQCCINSEPWTILGHEYEAHELLCTRIESESEDGGFSYLVNYEFQARDTVAARGDDPAIPGWDVGMFFVIQNGYAVPYGETSPKVFQSGQIPPDAPANVFQVYGEYDFTSLMLTESLS